MEWKDTTSYAQGERQAGAEPRVWTVTIAGIRVSVVRGHIYAKGKWVLHAAPWFDTKIIAPDTVSAAVAQDMALSLVGEKIDALQAAWHHEIAS